jgi:hypothetical protein
MGVSVGTSRDGASVEHARASRTCRSFEQNSENEGKRLVGRWADMTDGCAVGNCLIPTSYWYRRGTPRLFCSMDALQKPLVVDSKIRFHLIRATVDCEGSVKVEEAQ